MRLTTSLLFGVLFVTLSCQKNEPQKPSLNGVWQSVGSGWVLHIQDSTHYAMYDITKVSCLPSRKASLDEIMTSIELKNDTLSFIKGVMAYKFTPIEQLPELCAVAMSDDKNNDVLYNFEVFAQTVTEHYAFLELNQLDWPAIYKKQKKQITENPTQVQLYKTLEQTLEILNDNHAFLEANDTLYELIDKESEPEIEIVQENELPEYGDFVIADMTAAHHIVQDMTKDSWLIKWGKMENNIGYIQIKAMWLHANLEMPKSLVNELGYVDAYVKTFNQMEEGAYIQKEVSSVAKMMDLVMSDLAATDAMVIDVRFNGGGQDAVNFEILKRFNEQRRQIVNTKLKHKNGFSPQVPIYLETVVNPYTKPTFVLTSPQSGSAAESFAIGTIPIPHIKRIGAATQGALSTSLEKTLPNGWIFAISNELYMDLDGNSYENIGVPVDYPLGYSRDRQTFFRSVANDLAADKQSILTAMEALKKE